MPIKVPVPANVPEGQPLKKTFEELLTGAERAVLDGAIALVDRSLFPKMERSGNQKYVKWDSDKDPYMNVYTVTDEYDVVINTDGNLIKTSCYTSESGETTQNYKVVGYSYVLIQYIKKGKCIYQHIVTKEYKVQLYMRHKLNMSLG